MNAKMKIIFNIHNLSGIKDGNVDASACLRNVHHY
jgi:hypothetical protein